MPDFCLPGRRIGCAESVRRAELQARSAQRPDLAPRLQRFLPNRDTVGALSFRTRVKLSEIRVRAVTESDRPRRACNVELNLEFAVIPTRLRLIVVWMNHRRGVYTQQRLAVSDRVRRSRWWRAATQRHGSVFGNHPSNVDLRNRCAGMFFSIRA
jgi:hypothetical protein